MYQNCTDRFVPTKILVQWGNVTQSENVKFQIVWQVTLYLGLNALVDS